MKVPYSPGDADIMARTVFGEARGELRAGQVAVAWVIRNRAEMDLGNDGKPDWWGEGIAGVCLKSSRGIHQFSCWNRNDPNLKLIQGVTVANRAFRDCMAVVDEVLRDKVPDPTGGATHYHTRNILPKWAKGLRPCARVGTHVFYNNVP